VSNELISDRSSHEHCWLAGLILHFLIVRRQFSYCCHSGKNVKKSLAKRQSIFRPQNYKWLISLPLNLQYFFMHFSYFIKSSSLESNVSDMKKLKKIPWSVFFVTYCTTSRYFLAAGRFLTTSPNLLLFITAYLLAMSKTPPRLRRARALLTTTS
jgi:hypothetical protein